MSDEDEVDRTVAMAGPTPSGVLDALARTGLLDAPTIAQLRAAQLFDTRALGRELLSRGLLTPFQVNHLLTSQEARLVVGPYHLLARLGEGGMGQVFRARHSRLGTMAALKLVVDDRVNDRDAVARFLREVRAASQLSHPNIIRALDADEQNGIPWLAMELVEGTDLSRLVKEKGPLPLAQACDLVRQAALGLQHAHERGLVHRDIKPANLFLDQAGIVKVLDFGLARRVPSHDGDSSTTLTESGAVMGTPDYLAPEQIQDSHRVDIRADIYSLGCTLYHLVAGRVPFPAGRSG